MNKINLYDNTADIYDKRHDNETTKFIRKHEEKLLRKNAHGFVLDIGCGTGAHSHIFDNYIGIDISPAMIKEAINKREKSFSIASAENLPFKSETFDTIICMFTVLNLCDFRKAVKEMGRVVKKDGTVIVSVASVWDKKDYSLSDKFHNKYISDFKNIRIEKGKLSFKLFTKDELIKIFCLQNFSLKKFDSIYRWQNPHWNRYVSFTWKEKLKIFIEKFIPSQIGRIYLAVFRKL